MFLKVFLYFSIIFIIDLFILVEMGRGIGFLNVVMYLIFTSILGVYWAKLEGLKIINSFKNNLYRANVPSNNIIDGVLVFLGGVALFIPGIISDIIGLSLIIPLTRKFYRNYFRNIVISKIQRQKRTVHQQIDDVIDLN